MKAIEAFKNEKNNKIQKRRTIRNMAKRNKKSL